MIIPMEKSIHELMEWRFACKHFDQNKKIDDKSLRDILNTARLSPSSYGLQPWKFIVITNDDIKKQLAPACYNQPQITESSALVFFCARTDIQGDDGMVQKYIKKFQKDMNPSEEQLKGFSGMLTGDLYNRSPEALQAWTQRQVYIPAMTLILAAAEKGIDSCPMEGFDPGKVTQILQLPSFIIPTVLVALGYRSMNQPPKTRFDFNDVIEIRS